MKRLTQQTISAYPAAMRPSGWLYLAGACVAVLGLFVWWPFLIVATFVFCGAFIQRKADERERIRRSMIPRR